MVYGSSWIVDDDEKWLFDKEEGHLPIENTKSSQRLKNRERVSSTYDVVSA